VLLDKGENKRENRGAKSDLDKCGLQRTCDMPRWRNAPGNKSEIWHMAQNVASGDSALKEEGKLHRMSMGTCRHHLVQR